MPLSINSHFYNTLLNARDRAHGSVLSVGDSLLETRLDLQRAEREDLDQAEIERLRREVGRLDIARKDAAEKLQRVAAPAQAIREFMNARPGIVTRSEKPEKDGPKGDKLSKSLATADAKISKTLKEIQETESAPVPLAEIEQRVDGYIGALQKRGQLGGRRFASPSYSPGSADGVLKRDPLEIEALLHPDALKKRLIDEAKAWSEKLKTKPLTAAERAKALDALGDKLKKAQGEYVQLAVAALEANAALPENGLRQDIPAEIWLDMQGAIDPPREKTTLEKKGWRKVLPGEHPGGDRATRV